MTRSRLVILLLGALYAAPGSAQSSDSSVRLVVDEGTPLRVAVDRRVIVTHVGQPVEGVLVDPVFVYDRIVVPAGTRVIGHVDRRAGLSKKRRAMAMLSGDFTPLHEILLQFDATEQITLKIAGGAEKKKNVVSNATNEAIQQAKGTAAFLKGPEKAERMKDAALRALPYHPEFFSTGTVFNARLLSRLDFGAAAATPAATAGTAPAPESVLSARLMTPIESAHATRGTLVEAVLTRPVFSAARELILPAGAKLTGQVTFVRRACRFRRNGQLRFLFDTVHVPGGEPTSMLASLYSVEASRAERLAVDDEGARRLRTPRPGSLRLRSAASRWRRSRRGISITIPTVRDPRPQYGGPISGSMAGLVGASISGLLMSSLGHPAAVALGVIGVARSTYRGVIAKGREVVFPADTRIQVQLAPGPGKSPSTPERNTRSKEDR